MYAKTSAYFGRHIFLLAIFFFMITGSGLAQTNLSVQKKADVRSQQKKLKKKSNASVNESLNCLTFYESVFKSSLAVCSTGDNCREGLNFTKGPLQLPTINVHKVYNFSWSTERNELDGIVWQVSVEPFDCYSVDHPAGLVKQGFTNSYYDSWGTKKGVFSIDFNELNKQVLSPKAFQMNTKKVKGKKLKQAQLTNSNIALIAQFEKPTHYYVRFLPVFNGKTLAGSSNVISMLFDNRPADSVIEVVKPPEKHFPEIYSLKIESFDPIIFPSMKWGSMYVRGFDEALYKDALKNQLTRDWVKNSRADYENKLKNHIPIVPEAYKGEGSENWLESLWNAANSAVDWVSETYEWAKQQLVELAAVLVDQLPLIDCDDDCRALLQKGLEAGMVALGIPPSLPNADQLLNEGIDYLAAEVSNQVGCGEPCSDIIKDELKNLGDKLGEKQKQNVANEEEAHRHGVEPLNLPAWLKVKMAPEGGIQLPKLLLELKRNRMDISADDLIDLSAYYIRISFNCTNKAFKKGSKVSVPVNTVYKDGLPAYTDNEMLKLPETPEATLWASKLIPIPAIEKGSSLRIPVLLTDVPYLFPGHLELIRKEKGHIFFDDWSKMYMNGSLTIKVEIVGKQLKAVSWEEEFVIIETITEKINLPNEYNGGYLLPRRIQ